MVIKTARLICLLSLFTLCIAPFSSAFAAGKAEEEDTGLFGPRYEYVKMDPIMLPIISDDGVSQIVNLVVSLEIDSISLAAKAERLQPRLTDAFIQDMYGVLAQQAYKSGGMLQINVIKERLLKVSNEVLADDKNEVHDVLLQMIDQRRI